jgi:hypothetical protein
MRTTTILDAAASLMTRRNILTGGRTLRRTQPPSVTERTAELPAIVRLTEQPT